MKVYYAHCVGLYGTPQEQRDVALLEALGHEVVNPNQPLIEDTCTFIRAKAKAEGQDGGAAVMEFFKPWVQKQDALAFRALPDGAIPAGVAKEIQWAKEANIPVFELPSAIRRRCIDVDSTREYLQEVGKR